VKVLAEPWRPHSSFLGRPGYRSQRDGLRTLFETASAASQAEMRLRSMTGQLPRKAASADHIRVSLPQRRSSRPTKPIQRPDPLDNVQ
jgi:hypothetical protein